MKRSLILILSLLLVMGFSVSAFALHAQMPSETQQVVTKGKTTMVLGGEIRARGEYRHNTTDFDDDDDWAGLTLDDLAVSAGYVDGAAMAADIGVTEAELEANIPFLGLSEDDHTAAYDQRVRLHLNALVGDNTQGYIQLESSSGDSDTTDIWTWGNKSGATGNNGGGLGNAKRGDLRLLQAWIEHKMSFVGIKVGHMPIKLGRGLFVDHSKFGDDAILLFASPVEGLELTLATAKLNEQSANLAGDDHDVYSVMASYAGGAFQAGGDLTLVKVRDFGTEPLNFINLGLRGSANVAVVNIYGDVEIQSGKAKDGFVDRTGDTDDKKFTGYAGLLGVSANLNVVKVGLEAAYGSGDKRDYDNANLNDGTIFWDTENKDESFLTTLGADQHYTYVYEYRVKSAAGATSTGLANTMYVKANASVTPIPDLTADVAVYYLRAAQEVALMGAVDDDGSLETSRDLGVEVDAKVTYNIANNLVYFVEGGYLFAGKAYDHPDPEDGDTVSSDNAYSVRHGITLSF